MAKKTTTTEVSNKETIDSLNKQLMEQNNDILSKDEQKDVDDYLQAVNTNRFSEELIAGTFKSHDLINRIQLIKNKYQINL